MPDFKALLKQAQSKEAPKVVKRADYQIEKLAHTESHISYAMEVDGTMFNDLHERMTKDDLNTFIGFMCSLFGSSLASSSITGLLHMAKLENIEKKIQEYVDRSKVDGKVSVSERGIEASRLFGKILSGSLSHMIENEKEKLQDKLLDPVRMVSASACIMAAYTAGRVHGSHLGKGNDKITKDNIAKILSIITCKMFANKGFSNDDIREAVESNFKKMINDDIMEVLFNPDAKEEDLDSAFSKIKAAVEKGMKHD